MVGLLRNTAQLPRSGIPVRLVHVKGSFGPLQFFGFPPWLPYPDPRTLKASRVAHYARYRQPISL